MKHPRLLAALVLSACSAALLSCDDPTDPDDDEEFDATLSAAAETPAPSGNPTATGIATIEMDDDDDAGRVLRVFVRVDGNLTSAVTMAHIHGPATTATNAAIVLDFVPSMSAVIDAGARTGVMVNASFDIDALTPSSTGVLRVHPDTLLSFLRTGRAYVNVHTSTNPAGEIRGQITRDD